MSTFIDSTTNNSNSTTTFYSNSNALPSQQPQQQQQHQQQTTTDSTPLILKEEKSKTDLIVDYLVSPKPSTSLTDDTTDSGIRRSSIHTLKFENKKKPVKHFKSNPVKKQKLKKAKDEFQTLVDAFFLQLTKGCQQPHCKNKFCASGKMILKKEIFSITNKLLRWYHELTASSSISHGYTTCVDAKFKDMPKGTTTTAAYCVGSTVTKAILAIIV